MNLSPVAVPASSPAPIRPCRAGSPAVWTPSGDILCRSCHGAGASFSVWERVAILAEHEGWCSRCKGSVLLQDRAPAFLSRIRRDLAQRLGEVGQRAELLQTGGMQAALEIPFPNGALLIVHEYGAGLYLDRAAFDDGQSVADVEFSVEDEPERVTEAMKRTVPCPTCGAGTGSPCTVRPSVASGRVVSRAATASHERRRAAARHAGDRQAVDAIRELVRRAAADVCCELVRRAAADAHG